MNKQPLAKQTRLFFLAMEIHFHVLCIIRVGSM